MSTQNQTTAQLMGFANVRSTRTYTVNLLIKKTPQGWRPLKIMAYKNLTAYYLVDTQSEYLHIVSRGRHGDRVREVEVEMVRFVQVQGTVTEDAIKTARWTVVTEADDSIPKCPAIVTDVNRAIDEMLFHKPAKLPDRIYSEDDVQKALTGGVCVPET